MYRISLTEEELAKLLEAVNGGVEPPPELAGKLFPSLMEKLGQAGKFDFETLNRIRIPTIEYAGKRPEGVILASAVAVGQSAPLQVVRSFGEPAKGGWQNLIVQGDNLQFLKTVYLNQDPLIKDKVKGRVKLIYIDPPFATKADFQGGTGSQSYSDKIDSAEFLENLRERLLFLREVLSEDGCIYIHLDWRKCHYVKTIMDEIFGESNFQNEIVWQRLSARSDSKTYNHIHDVVYFYTKTQNFKFSTQYSDYSETYIKKFYRYKDEDGRLYSLGDLTARGLRGGETGRPWRGVEPAKLGNHWKVKISTLEELDRDGKIYWPPKGNVPRLKQYLDERKGRPLQSIWGDISPIQYSSPENTFFPTQKPEAFLERLIKASSNPGDLVMDVFAGSGTTAAVAEKLGRRWIVCDFGKHPIYIMQKRLLNIPDSKAFDAERKDAKYEQLPKPFVVAAVGAYDFSRVMNLRENKCAYISFVLSLFGIPKEEKNFIDKYKLDHIYAEKDGDPVEIFPVWEDEYLYKVRIDLDYLKDIITQSRGRLKGNYYIVVPETCTQVSDLKLPNNTGGEVQFRLLKFPYSILEQAARNFAIEEQPDTPANINNLVSSVGFYFNDEVTVKAARTTQGFKLMDFTTPILNREGGHYEGLSGLSLLLVDLHYNGEVFNMDRAVYAKEIPGSGEIELTGVTGKTAVIAIDRHGNESPPTPVSE